MELEGLSAKLTLDDGITSSSSSGDENTPSLKVCMKKTNKPTIILCNSRFISVLAKETEMFLQSTGNDI